MKGGRVHRNFNIPTPTYKNRIWLQNHEALHSRFRHTRNTRFRNVVEQPRREVNRYFYCYGIGRTMNIPVVHEDETENEFDIEICCDKCSFEQYGWSNAQFVKLWEQINKGEPIKVPSDIDSEAKFKNFVKSL